MSNAIASELAELRPRLRTVGITGTNGKTTTTSMVAAIVGAAGEPSARATTLGTWVDDRQLSDDVGLPAFRDLAREAARRGVATIAVETTSKALATGFARAWSADVAVFTNLTRDHLDVHGTLEAYLAAKAQLFMTVPSSGAVVWNLADPCSALLDEVAPRDARRFGWVVGEVHPDCVHLPLDLRAHAIRADVDGTRFEVDASADHETLSGSMSLSIVGDVHVRNALAAMLATTALGYGPDAIRAGLHTFGGVPGRFEIVALRPVVVVDYAHTPDALARTLTEARRLVGDGGRLTCVFGCGGERDAGKRPLMGRVADELADGVIATDDNPRGEDPERILDAIERGVEPSARRARWQRLSDRRAAIRRALAEAFAADVVVIAGRGHEMRQVRAEGSVAFSDRDVACEVLKGSP